MYSVSYFLALLALSGLIWYLIIYNWKRRHLYFAASKLNGPPALPFIGNALMFMCKNEEILMKIHNVAKESNNTPIRFWLGPMLLISFGNPDHVEKILSSSKFAHKHDIYKFAKVFLGEGLVTGSGPLYKKHRRIIQPLFNINFARESTSVIQKHVEMCMAKLGEFVNKGNFDFKSFTHKCMIDIVKEIIMGSFERSQINGVNDFDRAATDAYDFAFTRMVKPILQPDIIFNLTPYKSTQDQLKEAVKCKTKTFINESSKRRKIYKTTNEFHPIIDQLMDYREDHPEDIDDEYFLDHILTLYCAAEDTLTIICGFLSMCFGMYPEYQEKAAREIREIFGDTPRTVTFDDISKLQYLDMCLKDAFRLFPIAPVLLRKCTNDFQLDEWYIPEGCAIVVPIFSIHRDKRFWENPEHFHPDHFLPEIANKRHVYSYIPFSAGPRGCIGKIMANTAIKIFMCNLLQRFEVEADGKVPDLGLKMDISTRPKNGYYLRLKERVWK